MKKAKREPYYCDQRQSWVIQLTRGYECLFDKENIDIVKASLWYAKPEKNTAYAIARIGGKQKRMHRVFSGCPDNMVVDHINGDGLDNRVSNLKVCTARENHQNRAEHRDGKLVGCSFDICRKAWKSSIRIDNKMKHLGYYETEFEAHERYMEEYEKISGL